MSETDKTKEKKLYTEEELSEHICNQTDQSSAMVEHLSGRSEKSFSAACSDLESYKTSKEVAQTRANKLQALLKEKDGEIRKLQEDRIEFNREVQKTLDKLATVGGTLAAAEEEVVALKQKVEDFVSRDIIKDRNFNEVCRQRDKLQATIDRMREGLELYWKLIKTSERASFDSPTFYKVDDILVELKMPRIVKQACTEGTGIEHDVHVKMPPNSVTKVRVKVLSKKKVCPHCDGSGRYGTGRCEPCNGTGREVDTDG